MHKHSQPGDHDTEGGRCRIEVATFAKNSREEVRVSLDHYNGHDVINLRIWYQDESGEWRPGKQGLVLRREKLPDLAEAISTACRIVEEEAHAHAS